MKRTIGCLLALGFALGSIPARLAEAQQPGVLLPQGIASPTISPYVNLGFQANGLSNYQTLVKPLAEQRDMLARQSLVTERQLRATGAGQRGLQTDVRIDLERRGEARSGVANRFFNLSHYFGPLR